MSTTFTQDARQAGRNAANEYIKSTYTNVEDIHVMDVDVMGSRINYAGVVTFSDGTPSQGFDFAVYFDGTFDSLPSRVKGHVDLWDTTTREVYPVS